MDAAARWRIHDCPMKQCISVNRSANSPRSPCLRSAPGTRRPRPGRTRSRARRDPRCPSGTTSTTRARVFLGRSSPGEVHEATKLAPGLLKARRLSCIHPGEIPPTGCSTSPRKRHGLFEKTGSKNGQDIALEAYRNDPGRGRADDADASSQRARRRNRMRRGCVDRPCGHQRLHQCSARIGSTGFLRGTSPRTSGPVTRARRD